MYLRWAFVYLIMLQLVVLSRAFRLSNALLRRTSIRRPFASRISATDHQQDSLITGLNGAQDITVKVLSCKNLLQEMMKRNDLSPLATKYLGELVTCSLMMGAGLKGEESLQLNLVGDRGIKNIIAITNGNLEVRGSVGNTQFGKDADIKEVHPSDLLGNGEVQIVRNHPAWKHPMNGITEIRETSIATNLALYMVESEQRPSAILTDVQIEGDKVISALGLMVETLPGALPENIETSIANLEAVQKIGLFSYITNYCNEQNASVADSVSHTTDSNFGAENEKAASMSTLAGGELTSDERHRAENLFASLDSPLDRILDDCLVSMDQGSIRWDKKPTFKCTCGVEKVWRALKLLGTAEVEDIVAKQEDVKVNKISLLRRN